MIFPISGRGYVRYNKNYGIHSYGTSLYNWSLFHSKDSQGNPIAKWNSGGFVFPKEVDLERIKIKGYTNATIDFDLHIFKSVPKEDSTSVTTKHVYTKRVSARSYKTIFIDIDFTEMEIDFEINEDEILHLTIEGKTSGSNRYFYMQAGFVEAN